MASNFCEKDVTLAKRLEIVEKLEAGVNINELAKQYALSRRTIQRYRQNSILIKQSSENPKNMQKKRQRDSLYKDIDNRLYNWCVQQVSSNVSISDRVLHEKAKELYAEFGGPSNFTASRGWLWRFKRRYDISRLTKIHGEPEDANNVATNKFACLCIRDFEKLLENENIHEENVYNMSESSLFWRTPPCRASVYKDEGEKSRNDRVTVAFCANSTGTHKLPLLFVHKYENPRALKHCKHTLPVSYRSQINGCVNEEIFRDWYINDFKQSVKQHQLRHHWGNVLLIVDNFSGHKLNEEELDDGYFKVMFLPPNTTSFIQPMDQGVITKCKKLFRRALLQRVLQYDGLPQFYADYDIKDCIDLITKAWNEITTANIYDSWRKLLNRPPVFINTAIQDSECTEQIEFLNIPAAEVAQWISECEKEEATKEKAAAEDGASTPPRSLIRYEEIVPAIYNLRKIALIVPEMRVHAKTILDHFYKTIHK